MLHERGPCAEAGDARRRFDFGTRRHRPYRSRQGRGSGGIPRGWFQACRRAVRSRCRVDDLRPGRRLAVANPRPRRGRGRAYTGAGCARAGSPAPAGFAPAIVGGVSAAASAKGLGFAQRRKEGIKIKSSVFRSLTSRLCVFARDQVFSNRRPQRRRKSVSSM